MTIEPAAALHSHTRPVRERLHREAALDETIEQSFPASDPLSTDPNPDSDPGEILRGEISEVIDMG